VEPTMLKKNDALRVPKFPSEFDDSRNKDVLNMQQRNITYTIQTPKTLRRYDKQRVIIKTNVGSTSSHDNFSTENTEQQRVFLRIQALSNNFMS